VLEMRGQNKTWQEVAQHFGVSVRTAQNWAKE
jgi:transposase